MNADKIVQCYEDGRLNDYMLRRLLKAVESGINDSLSDELIQDAQDASGLGVNNDRDYAIHFFINHFLDDMMQDTFGMKLDDVKRSSLKQHLFAHKDDPTYKFDSLVDFRLLIFDWLCTRLTKKAHPNIGGKNEREVVYNIDKWISALKNIYTAVHNKASKSDAIKYFTQAWDSDERQHFINWMKYYEGGNMEKYNVKNAKFTKEADLDFAVPQSWMNDAGRSQNAIDLSTRKIDTEKTRREAELENAKHIKRKMRGRLLAFKKLLDRYNDILPKQNLEKIYDEIHDLDVSISRLDVYASMQDCLYRSAGKIRKFGFSEGAEFLEKVAEEPAAGKDVIQSLPQGASPQTNLPPKTMPAINIKTIIARLEGVSKTLKSRDMIRELASIDILLNELGIASHFPELSLSQSKLIEAFSYSSNKIEDIIANLRGSGISRPKAPEIKAPIPQVKTVPPAKPLDTGEIMAKPIEEVKQELPKESPAPKKAV